MCASSGNQAWRRSRAGSEDAACRRPRSRRSGTHPTSPPPPNRRPTGRCRRWRAWGRGAAESPPTVKPIGLRFHLRLAGDGAGATSAIIAKVEQHPVSSFISPKAKKGSASGIEGRGLFAHAAIDPGEVVAVKGGHIVDTGTLAALPERLQNSELQIADGLHLVALTDDEYELVMLFLNHSCEPNVGFAGNVVLVTMRDVSAGEELTTDYALFDTSDEAMACRCASPSCRRTISGSDWRRPELQVKYHGFFSWYLQRRIEQR